MAQSVKRQTLAQVRISQFVSSSPTSGSVPIAQSLEPASDPVSPSLSTPPMLALCLSLSLSKINKHLKKILLNIYLLLGDRERQSVSRGGAEREGDTGSEAGSRLQAVRTEPEVGLEFMN